MTGKYRASVIHDRRAAMTTPNDELIVLQCVSCARKEAL